jgi:hypothetical protein
VTLLICMFVSLAHVRFIIKVGGRYGVIARVLVEGTPLQSLDSSLDMVTSLDKMGKITRLKILDRVTSTSS